MAAPIIKLRMMYTVTLPQTALKQVHLLYITTDVFLITKPCILVIFFYLFICDAWLTAKQDILQITLRAIQWHMPINVGSIIIICLHATGASETK